MKRLTKGCVAKAALILLALLTWGCAPLEPPRQSWIDPRLSDSEQAVVRDAVAAWCDAVAWCPTESDNSDHGRFEVVSEIAQDDMAPCPEGRKCEVAARNAGGVVLINSNRMHADDLDLLWIEVAHEIGHFCTRHTDSGLMAAYHEPGEPLVIDEVAVEAWRAGCD